MKYAAGFRWSEKDGYRTAIDEAYWCIQKKPRNDPRLYAGSWAFTLLPCQTFAGRPTYEEQRVQLTVNTTYLQRYERMGDFETLRKKIAAASERIRQDGTRIMAETATEFYKQRFTTKEWEGVSWAAAKNPPQRGSLLVRSGALVSTIRPARVTPSEATIRAGSPRVPYARIHNEGGTIEQKPTPKQRRFFWAKAYAADETTDGSGLGRWGRAAVAKQLHITIPQRKFIGKSVALNRRIVERLRALISL